MFPKEIQNFIDVFSKLPSIGPRMATRLALFLSSLDEGTLTKLHNALGEIKNMKRCPRCFFPAAKEKDVCAFCSDNSRNKSLVMVVEKETDVVSIEKTGEFKGMYFIFGTLSSRGIIEEYQKARIEKLIKIIKEDLGGNAEEVIIALEPNSFGDFVSGVIREKLRPYAKKITMLGRGIPTGGEIEFTDEETLRGALRRRD